MGKMKRYTILVFFLKIVATRASTYYFVDYVTNTCVESPTPHGPGWEYSTIDSVCEGLGFDYTINKNTKTMLRFRPQDN